MSTAELSEGEIPSDAVTADLRTTDNALSFWRCDAPDRAQIEDAALAMAAAGNRIDRMDVVWIAVENLRADGQTWKETEGQPPHQRCARAMWMFSGSIMCASETSLSRSLSHWTVIGISD
jgi:hypothetical protein